MRSQHYRDKPVLRLERPDFTKYSWFFVISRLAQTWLVRYFLADKNLFSIPVYQSGRKLFLNLLPGFEVFLWQTVGIVLLPYTFFLISMYLVIFYCRTSLFVFFKMVQCLQIHTKASWLVHSSDYFYTVYGNNT